MTWVSIATGARFRGEIPQQVTAIINGYKPVFHSRAISASFGDDDYNDVLTLYMLQRGYIEDSVELNEDIIDEDFALRLKRGGPKWERSTNAYEMALRTEYDAWVNDTAKAVEAASEDDWRAELRDKVDDLILLLILLGRRNLIDAYTLGLGEAPASPEGMRELADAIAQNEMYLRDSLGPSLIAKTEQRIIGEPDLRLDRVALTALLGTFVARVGSYAGAFWAIIMRGVLERIRQKPDAGRARWVLEPLAKHCSDCPQIAGTYDSYDALLARTGGHVPASGGTQCLSNCRCWIEEEKAPGVWVRMFSDDGGEEFGGPGSGHHGHKGVPGSKGGSSPGGASVAFGTNDVGIAKDDSGEVVREKLRAYTREYGVEAGALFDKDGNVLRVQTGSETNVVGTTAGQIPRGSTSVHTHPIADSGKTFSTPSKADVNSFYQDQRLAKMEILTADGGTWELGRIRKGENLSGFDVKKIQRDAFDDLTLGVLGDAPALLSADWHKAGYKEVGNRLGLSISFSGP